MAQLLRIRLKPEVGTLTSTSGPALDKAALRSLLRCSSLRAFTVLVKTPDLRQQCLCPHKWHGPPQPPQTSLWRQAAGPPACRGCPQPCLPAAGSALRTVLPGRESTAHVCTSCSPFASRAETSGSQRSFSFFTVSFPVSPSGQRPCAPVLVSGLPVCCEAYWTSCHWTDLTTTPPAPQI